MNSATGGGEPERDAWLREALRHAPDADAAPPAAVQKAILMQARAAAAGATMPRPVSRWANAWAWLARPPIAAGFASVMVATLVGVMWWDQPIDEALPRAPAPERRPGAASASLPPPAPLAAARDSALTAAPAPAAADAATQAARAPAPAAPAAARPPVKATRRAAPAINDAAQTPEVAEPREPVPFENERKGAAAAPSAPTPAPAAAPAARMRESAAGADAADERAPALRGESAAAAAASSGSLAARAFAKAAAAPPEAAAMPLQQNSDKSERMTAPLAGLLASIAEAPQRWAVERGGNTQAVSAPLQRWLARLEAESASRWRAAAGAAPSDGSTVVRFYRDGGLRATLYVDEGGVWVVSPEAPARNSRAALSPTVGAALQRTLDDAMR